MSFNFTKPTLLFAIPGLFIPGFTASGLVGLQILLGKAGIECSVAWTIIWTTTMIGGLLLPFLFYRHITRLPEDKLPSLETQLGYFNLAEYVFIQASLLPLFTSVQTVCYESDGQNGLELFLTAWMALPVLVLLSFGFNHAMKRNEKLKK